MLREDELIGRASAWADVALDYLPSSDVIFELPIVGGFVLSAQMTRGVRDRTFLKKIEAFLKGMGRISDEKKCEFYERLVNDETFGRKTGELVLFSVDRSDSLEKCSIIGRLFCCLVGSEMDFLTFRRLLFAVDKAFIDDLIALPNFVRAPASMSGYYPLSLHHLDGTGLTRTIYPKSEKNEPVTTPRVIVSDFGKCYATFLYGFDVMRTYEEPAPKPPPDQAEDFGVTVDEAPAPTGNAQG